MFVVRRTAPRRKESGVKPPQSKPRPEPSRIAVWSRKCRCQIETCLPKGRFVVAVGTEVLRDTPVDHVDALIQTAHEYG